MGPTELISKSPSPIVAALGSTPGSVGLLMDTQKVPNLIDTIVRINMRSSGVKLIGYPDVCSFSLSPPPPSSILATPFSATPLRFSIDGHACVGSYQNLLLSQLSKQSRVDYTFNFKITPSHECLHYSLRRYSLIRQLWSTISPKSVSFLDLTMPHFDQFELEGLIYGFYRIFESLSPAQQAANLPCTGQVYNASFELYYPTFPDELAFQPIVYRIDFPPDSLFYALGCKYVYITPELDATRFTHVYIRLCHMYSLQACCHIYYMGLRPYGIPLIKVPFCAFRKTIPNVQFMFDVNLPCFRAVADVDYMRSLSTVPLFSAFGLVCQCYEHKAYWPIALNYQFAPFKVDSFNPYDGEEYIFGSLAHHVTSYCPCKDHVADHPNERSYRSYQNSFYIEDPVPEPFTIMWSKEIIIHNHVVRDMSSYFAEVDEARAFRHADSRYPSVPNIQYAQMLRDDEEKPEKVNKTPIRGKTKFVSRNNANQRVADIMHGPINQRQVVTYQSNGVPARSVTTQKYKSQKSRKDKARPKNLTARQKAVECTKMQSITLVEPRLIGLKADYHCSDEFWDWKTATNDFMTHSQFISVALVEYGRMHVEYDRLTPYNSDGSPRHSDHLHQYLHCYLALCLGFKLTYYWKDFKTNQTVVYVVPLVRKAHRKMFKCFDIPMFQYVAHMAKNYKIMNYLTNSWSIVHGHPDAKLLHRFNRKPHDFNCLGDERRMEAQGFWSLGKTCINLIQQSFASVIAKILSFFSKKAISAGFDAVKEAFLKMFREIKERLLELGKWCLSKLEDLGQFLLACAGGFFEAMRSFKTKAVSRVMSRFQEFFGLDVVVEPVDENTEGVKEEQAQGLNLSDSVATIAVFASQLSLLVSGVPNWSFGKATVSFFTDLGRASRGAEITKDFLKSMANAIYHQFTGSHLFESDLVAERISKLANVVANAEKLIHANGRYGVVPQDAVTALNTAYSELKQISISLMSKQKTGSRTVADGLLQIVEESMEKCLILQAQSFSRIHPVCIFMHGPSKQGKTHVAGSIAQHILEEFLLKLEAHNNLYPGHPIKNPFEGVKPLHSVKAFECTKLEDYLEGYNNQFCVILDELYSSCSDETNSFWSCELQSWLDRKSCPLKMAFGGKGKTFFTTPIVICTTNREGHILQTVAPTAYHRRIDFDINVESLYVSGDLPHNSLSCELTSDGKSIHSDPILRNHNEFRNRDMGVEDPFNYPTLVDMAASVLFDRIKGQRSAHCPSFTHIKKTARPAVKVGFGSGAPVSSTASVTTSNLRGQRAPVRPRRWEPSPQLVPFIPIKTLKNADLRDFGPSLKREENLTEEEYLARIDEACNAHDKSKDTEQEAQGRIFYKIAEENRYYLSHAEGADIDDVIYVVASDRENDVADVARLVMPSELPSRFAVECEGRVDEDEDSIAVNLKKYVATIVRNITDKPLLDQVIEPELYRSEDNSTFIARVQGALNDSEFTFESRQDIIQCYYENGRLVAPKQGSLARRFYRYLKSKYTGVPIFNYTVYDRATSYVIEAREPRFPWLPAWVPESLRPQRRSYQSYLDPRLVRDVKNRCSAYANAHSTVTADYTSSNTLHAMMSAADRDFRKLRLPTKHIKFACELFASDLETSVEFVNPEWDWAHAYWLSFGDYEPELSEERLFTNHTHLGFVHAIALFLMGTDVERSNKTAFLEKDLAIACMNSMQATYNAFSSQVSTDNFMRQLMLNQSYMLATNWLVKRGFYTKTEIAVRSLSFYRRFHSSAIASFLTGLIKRPNEFMANCADEHYRTKRFNLCVGAIGVTLGVIAVSFIVKKVFSSIGMAEAQGLDYEKNPMNRTDVSSMAKHQKQLHNKAAYARRMLAQADLYDPVLNKIQSASYLVMQMNMKGDIGMVGHSIFTKANFCTFNRHVWQYLHEEFYLIPISDQQKLIRCHKSTCIVRFNPEDRDMVVVEVPNAMFHKDLYNHIPAKDDVARYRGSNSALILKDKSDVIDEEHLDDATVRYGWSLMSPLTMCSDPLRVVTDKVNNLDIGTFSLYYAGIRGGNQAGDSGSAIAFDFRNETYLAGFHMSGSPTNHSVGIVPFYRSDREDIMKNLSHVAQSIAQMNFGVDDPLGVTNTDNMFKATCAVNTVATNFTVFVPTPFNDPDFEIPCMKSPAHLDNEAYKIAASKREDAANKVRSMHPWAIREIREQGYRLMDDFTAMSRTPAVLGKCRTLLPTEAIYGNKDHVDKCDFSTSDGIRCRKLGVKKENLADPESEDAKKIISTLWMYVQMFARGMYTYAIAADCLKDELRDLERVKLKKTRIFYILDFIDCMLQKMAIGDFMCRLKQYFIATKGACGIPPGRRHWAFLYEKFVNSCFGIVCSDIATNDSIMHLLVLHVFAPWTWTFYPAASSPGPCRDFITWAYLANFMCIRFNRGKGWLMGTGNPSGGFMTTHFNTCYNHVLHKICFQYACHLRGISDYRDEYKYFQAIFYSDDNMSASLKYDWWTVQELASHAKVLFGIVITDPEKGTDFQANLPISRVSFLSRAFYPNPKIPNLIHAPLAFSSLVSQLFYVRRAKGEGYETQHVLDQLQINLRNISLELLEYPYEEACEIYRKITTFIAKKNLPLQLEFFTEEERNERCMINQL